MIITSKVNGLESMRMIYHIQGQLFGKQEDDCIEGQRFRKQVDDYIQRSNVLEAI